MPLTAKFGAAAVAKPNTVAKSVAKPNDVLRPQVSDTMPHTAGAAISTHAETAWIASTTRSRVYLDAQLSDLQKLQHAQDIVSITSRVAAASCAYCKLRVRVASCV